MTTLADSSLTSRPLADDASATPAWMRWSGRVLTALPALMLFASAAMKLSHQPGFVSQWVGKLGYSEGTLTAVGLVELASAVLFVIPRTAVLGALLLTAYLGGATATHVRVGDPFVTPVVLGVLVWAGLFLRDARLRALLLQRGAGALTPATT